MINPISFFKFVCKEQSVDYKWFIGCARPKKHLQYIQAMVVYCLVYLERWPIKEAMKPVLLSTDQYYKRRQLMDDVIQDSNGEPIAVYKHAKNLLIKYKAVEQYYKEEPYIK